MALKITDTGAGKRAGLPDPGERGARLQARAVFVGVWARSAVWR